ncbi:FtsX-like permease family protein [Arthrobacter sp. H35-D1]|uniref:FtsX-like permease family protein n=1 Tax=Arthrobacter sp. H35-D1 TaxID=3046202 RepID=UPI0024B92F49|nr:FtsX-like permease family protein [Arthrobacter sp. H35-D1]MDJ0314054.1 hypothetical protein [Arthrobacter sp. H35-D1]
MVRGPVTSVVLLLFALIAGFISSYLYYGNVPMQRAYEATAATSNVEEFRFLPTLNPADGEKARTAAADGTVNLLPYYQQHAQNLAAHYGFNTEAIRQKSVEADGMRYAMGTVPQRINRIVLVDGTANLTAGSVLVTAQPARLAGLHVGGHLTVDGIEYRIAGTYTQPSQSLLGTTGGAALGNAANTGVLMTEGDFEAVPAQEELAFAGVVPENGSLTAVLEDLRASVDVGSVTRSDQLSAMSSLRSNFSTSLTFMLIGTALFAAAIVLVVWQVMRNNLRRSVAVIGVMNAMGLPPLGIVASFMVYVAPIVLGVAGGAALGLLLAPSFSAGYLELFNVVVPPIPTEPAFTLGQLGLALLIPLAVCAVTAFRLVRAPVLHLLNGRVLFSPPPRRRKLSSLLGRLKLATRVRAVFALSSPARIAVVLGSAAVSVLVLAFSLSIVSMASRPGAQLAESMNFERLVQYAAPQEGAAGRTDVGYADRLYVADADSESAGPGTVDRSYDSMFVAPGFDAVRAAGPAGQQVFESLAGDGADGVVVSSKFAAEFGVSVGDVVRIQPQQLDAAAFRVVGINPVALDTRLYFKGQHLPEAVVGADAGNYNTAFVAKDAAAPSNAESTSTTKAALVAQAQDAIAASFGLVPILVGIAVVLAVGVLFLIAYLNVFDNRRAIALLDQLGYRPRESLSLVINVYGMFIVAGAMFGAILSPALLTFFGGLVSDASDYHLVLAVSWPALVVLVVLVAGFAQLAHLLVLPWVSRISPTAVSYT